MDEPELWTFVLANVSLFVVSSVLTGLSYLAYRRSDDRSSFRFASVGFGLVVLGGLVEPLYQLVVRGDYNITGSELLLLQTGEGFLIAGGLGILFYAITHHRTNSPGANAERTAGTEEFTYTVETTENESR